MEVMRHGKAGRDVVLVGHAGHPEVEGTMGQWDPSNAGAIHLVETPECVEQLMPRNREHIAYATQTTLSIDDTRAVIQALQKKFPAIVGPRHDDICYATQNRQDAVRRLGQQCDLVLVVGSPNSSNSNRLRELAEKQGVPAHLIDGAGDIQPQWLEGHTRIGVTAGASAPESLVREVIARLRDAGARSVRELEGEPENVTFALPKELRLRVVG
jgi:4-hydroxy-3-methylbut-2-enyl diphosphate reductase